MLHYARIFVFCISLARIQRLQPAYANSNPDTIDENVMNLWQSLVTTIMDQLGYLINESSYRYQLTWAPTYPALTIAFVSKSAKNFQLISISGLTGYKRHLLSESRDGVQV